MEWKAFNECIGAFYCHFSTPTEHPEAPVVMRKAQIHVIFCLQITARARWEHTWSSRKDGGKRGICFTHNVARSRHIVRWDYVVMEQNLLLTEVKELPLLQRQRYKMGKMHKQVDRYRKFSAVHYTTNVKF